MLCCFKIWKENPYIHSAYKYRILNKLNEGTFANVYRVMNKDTHKLYAMKKLKYDISNKGYNQFKHEVGISKRLRHVFICNYIESYINTGGYHIIFEHIKGQELFSYIS